MMTPLHRERGDDISQYETALWLHPSQAPTLILARHANGDCVYLGEFGCTIHDRAPYECRQFDCRETFRNSDRPGRKWAIKHDKMPKAIFDRGRELLRQGK
jgi:hypothetical protein